MIHFKTLKEKYIEIIANKLCISIDDLTSSEKQIIDITFDILEDRLQDMKALEDDNKRFMNENSNLKAFQDDRDFEE
jgi:hypothetical protein